MSIVIGLILVAAVGWLVARPLLHPAAGGVATAGTDDELTLRRLAELEYDYRMGKIDADEYRQQRSRLQGREGGPERAGEDGSEPR